MKKTIYTAVLATFVLVLASCGSSQADETTVPATDSIATVVPCDTVQCDSTCIETNTLVK